MTSAAAHDGRSGGLAGPAWLILALACACQFMVILDTAIVNVALPSISGDLGFTPAGLAWVVNGYLLTFAGFLLTGGRATDLFGHRRMLIAGVALFSAASVVAGSASAAEVLVGARVVQGVGAAMLAPATLAVLNVYFVDPGARSRAFGAWSAAGGLGGMAGAIAGGALTSGLSWRWVFLINAPIGVVLVVVAFLALAGTRPDRREPLDVAGAVTATAGLAALTYGVMQASSRSGSSVAAVAAAAGLLLLVVFVVVEARFARHPMMPLRLFNTRSVALGSGMLLLFGGIPIAMWFFSSLLLQNVLGYNAIEAGLAQTPAAVLFVVIARCAATLLPRIGARPLVMVASGCFVAGFGWLAQATADTTYVAGVLGPTLLVAVGIGLTFPTLMAIATTGVPGSDAGIVGGLATTATQVGGSVGLAVLITAAGTRTGADPAAPAAFAAGYSLVFIVATGFAVALALAGMWLPAGRTATRTDQPA